jgi:hypothetical protein
MKSFKVQVDDAKASFLVELFQSLAFVKYEEVDGFHEPRIYPGGQFEIRAQSAGKTRVVLPKVDPTALQHEDAMKNLREAMKAIEIQRDRNRQ